MSFQKSASTRSARSSKGTPQKETLDAFDAENETGRSTRQIIATGIFGAVFVTLVTAFLAFGPLAPRSEEARTIRDQVLETLRPLNLRGEYPSALQMKVVPEDASQAYQSAAHVDYTIEPVLQKRMEKLFRRYRPDYGAFVAIDATTGRILSMVSHIKNPAEAGLGNLVLRASFPAASVFKIITAAAAIGSRKVNANTVIPYNGRNHTLYKRNVLKEKHNRWTRYMTLREAFGRSVNSVFGKLGLFFSGPEQLMAYAERFGFNRQIQFDHPLQISRVEHPEGNWELAESASGFTRKNKLSPLHGALLAATVANQGATMRPFLVEGATTESGTVLFKQKPELSGIAIDPLTASELRTLMTETVTRGTSRGSFRTFVKHPRFQDIEVGGKTGSLTGLNPRGKVDWFVGYALGGEHKIAVAALTVNKRYWTVRSAYLANQFFHGYFRLAQKRRRVLSGL